MNTIKKVLYGGSSALLLLPAVASAGWLTDSASSGQSSSSIRDLVNSFMTWLLVIFGLIAIIAFVVAGILYLTAAGDEDQIAKAKRAMIYSIIGVVVALIGYIILTAVTAMLTESTSF